MTWTLAFVGVSTLVAAGFFARVGFALRARRTSRVDDDRAVRAFSTWWLAMAGSTACVGAIALIANLEPPPTLAVAILRAASLVLLSIAMWGLLAHVVYLYRGRDASRVIAVLYSFLTAAVLANLVYSQPNGVSITDWTADVQASRQIAAWSTPIFIAAYLLPPIVAGIAYLRLVPSASDPAQRARLRATGIGIALWVSTHVFARMSDAPMWQFATRVVIGLAVAFAIWRAYFPSEVAPSSPGLDERLRQLI